MGEVERATVIRRSGLVRDGGSPVTLVGTPIGVGDRAPEFQCVRQDPETSMLESVCLDDTAGVRLFSSVPSVDTPVCAMQTVRFAHTVAALGDRVQAWTVSVDTPYALGRFCAASAIGAGGVISDYRPGRSFGHAWGVLMQELGELARAVFVVDDHGIVRYVEVVAETGDHPDYDAALGALRATLTRPLRPD